MENHNSPTQPEESRPKKRPRIPFQHKISVKPTDLDERKSVENLDLEADSPEDDYARLIDLDLDTEGAIQPDPYFKTSDFDDDSQEYGQDRDAAADQDDYEEEGENGSEDLPDGLEEDYFGLEEPDTSESDDSQYLY